MDIKKLIQPVSVEAPSGENMEYDERYMALEELAEGIPEKEMSDSVIKGHGPDWKKLKENCHELLLKTKDLRVAVYLCLAELNLNGFSGFRDGLELIQQLLDQQWDTLWPNLDPDDDNDPVERVNILSSLSPNHGAYKDPMMFILRVRETPIAKSKQLGIFSIKDVMLASGELELKDKEPIDLSLIKGAFLDTSKGWSNSNYKAICEIEIIINKISDFLKDKIENGAGIDFTPLMKTIKKIKTFFEETDILARANEEITIDDSPEKDVEIPDSPKKDTTQIPLSPTNLIINSRSDAIEALKKVSSYYKRTEPNSPVPYLLERAAKVAQMSYIELIHELMPESVNEARSVLGVKTE